MEKIVTIEEQEKKSNRNKIIIGIILVGLLIFSTAGYALFQRNDSGDTAKKVIFNGIRFDLLEDGLWHSTINGYEFATSYNPKETENISANIAISVSNYYNQNLYFSYDSDREAVGEIVNNLGRFLIKQPQFACLDECSEDLPVKNCTSNIISVKELNSTSLIKQENNCIYIIADKENILKASDAFIFKIAGL